MIYIYIYFSNLSNKIILIILFQSNYLIITLYFNFTS